MSDVRQKLQHQQSVQVAPAAQKKIQGSYYRVMVNLPVIIKEKELIDRKKTIEVFKKSNTSNQKQQIQGKTFQSKKKKDDQIGKIFINQLWSEKFHKLVLKESKIQEVLERISKLYRRNVEDFVDDIHQASVAKQKSEENLLAKHIAEQSCETPTHKNVDDLSMIAHAPPAQHHGLAGSISLPKLISNNTNNISIINQNNHSMSGFAAPVHNMSSFLPNNNKNNNNNNNNSSYNNFLQGNHAAAAAGGATANVTFDEVREILPSILNKSLTSPQNFKGQPSIFQAIDPIDLDPSQDTSQSMSIQSPQLNNLQTKLGSPITNKIGGRSTLFNVRGKKNEIKRHDLAKPRHNIMENTIDPKLFNSTQRIIQQCSDLNADWEKERVIQSEKIPFYINKDDRY